MKTTNNLTYFRVSYRYSGGEAHTISSGTDAENVWRTLERARGNLVKFKAKLKAERARDRFVREHGGWGSGLIDRILHDEAMKAAFFANDFATVEKLLAETAVPVNAGENKP